VGSEEAKTTHYPLPTAHFHHERLIVAEEARLKEETQADCPPNWRADVRQTGGQMSAKLGGSRLCRRRRPGSGAAILIFLSYIYLSAFTCRHLPVGIYLSAFTCRHLPVGIYLSAKPERENM